MPDPIVDTVENPAETQVETAPDRSALEARILAKFAEVDPEATPTAETEEETPAVVDEVKPGIDAPAKTDEPEAEAAVEEPADRAVSDIPILPAAYRRSLKAYEWTDDEIDSALKQGGEKFVQSAGKMHDTRSKEVSQWAALGRQKVTDTTAKVEATEPQTQTIKPVDVKALKAKYGDEALIDELVGPLNAMAEKLNAMLPQVQATQAASQAAKQEALGRQIDGFFGGKDLNDYKDVYGVETGRLTNEQLESRNKVLVLADALIGGASLQGRRLSFDEAMMLAHDSVSGPAKAQAARTKLTGTLQAREKAITLRPATRKPGQGGIESPAKKRSDLERRTQTALNKAFGG